MNLNKALVAGRLTRDVEMRYTPAGVALAKIGMACNRKYKDTKTNEQKEEVTFVDVTLWGKTAELVQQYCTKGSELFVEGRLTLDSWEDKQSGQKRSKLYVTGENIQFIGGKKDQASAGQNSPTQTKTESTEGEKEGESCPF